MGHFRFEPHGPFKYLQPMAAKDFKLFAQVFLGTKKQNNKQ